MRMNQHPLKRNLESTIMERLKSGTAGIPELIEEIRRFRPGTTKQGVYAAIRKLRRGEKITVHGGRVSLNTVWIEQMLEYFAVAQHNYSEKFIRDNGFAYLNEGEKVQYLFRNPVLADTFWSHALLILSNSIPPDKDLFFYCPHEWFLLAREKSELTLLRSISSRGRRLIETIGHRTKLDYYVVKEFQRARMSYDLLASPLFKQTNYYVNVMGEYLIEVYLDKRIAGKLHDFFLSAPGWSMDAKNKLDRIILAPGKIRIVISKNSKKSARLAALLAPRRHK